MQIIDVKQGTPEWLALRTKYFTASNAAAMMGASKYKSRQELLRELATGIVPDVDAATQARFDAGHDAEEKARAIIEAQIGIELYPVTCVETVDGVPLLASMDGLTMDESMGWECKLWNKSLVDAIGDDNLSAQYYWQLEQQLLVTNAEHILFTVSDGTPENTLSMEYRSLPERRSALIAGWMQFRDDLANYQHVEIAKPVVADAQMSLPTVSIRVDGAIAIIDNLDEFTEAAAAYTDQVKALVKKADKDDQDFANLSAANKKLKEVEELLDASENNALSQIEPVEIMRRKKAYVTDMIRGTRLLGEKAEKSEKENRRADIVNKAKTALFNHVSALNTRLGKNYMPVVLSDFPGVIKGKKTITSLQDAADAELARCKILANEIADSIQINLNTLRDMASDYKTLFSDAATIVLKNNDDLVALVKMRISEHEKELADKKEREQAALQAKEERERQEAEMKAAKLAEIAPAPVAQPVQEVKPVIAQPVTNTEKSDDPFEIWFKEERLDDSIKKVSRNAFINGYNIGYRHAMDDKSA